MLSTLAMRSLSLPAALALLALLPSCASDGDRYPSLAIRDAERASGSLETPEDAGPPPAPEPIAADLQARLAQLRGDAAESHRTFLDIAPRAQNLVVRAQGAPVASDIWASAQVVLAELDSARSTTAVPLAELELIYADAALEFEQRAEIVAARDAVLAMVAEEDAVLARLRGRLAG